MGAFQAGAFENDAFQVQTGALSAVSDAAVTSIDASFERRVAASLERSVDGALAQVRTVDTV